jgi:hypothetical protein
VPYCWPGHTKRDYHYSIVELQPDIVQSWYGMQVPEIEAFLKEHYIPASEEAHLYVKKNSSEIQLQPDEAQQLSQTSAKWMKFQISPSILYQSQQC